MIHLSELISEAALYEALRNGYVREQTHPTEPLAILNYTAQCQWERAWGDVTRQCRGLIYRNDTGEVVARPWEKFFNYGEPAGEGTLRDLDEPVRVFDKLDGSLGILYWTSDFQPQIATRGSFTSEQALWANMHLSAKYPEFEPHLGLTYLFEIVYPGNRIVVDYQGMEDLVLLDVLETETGNRAPDHYWYDWEGPVAEELDAETLREALELEPRPNAEGIVIRFEDGGMLKIKQEDYVALHRIVTGLNERTVWEHLAAGKATIDLLRDLPEEFRPWVLGVASSLSLEFLRIKTLVKEEFENTILVVSGCGNQDWTRKDFAHYVTKEYTKELWPLLFMLLDGKDIDEPIWKSIRPVAPKPMMQHSEDVA